MDAATLAAICMLHVQNPAAYPLPSPVFNCATVSAASISQPAVKLAVPIVAPAGGGAAGWLERLRPVVSSTDAREAMARTVIAEAGNQGDSGMAGVVYTILNRLADGRWGGTLEAVVDAPGQFEPVMRAGGSWRGLRPVSTAQFARVSTIVNLALDGRLPDLTGGARYFQNPQIVASRAQAGTVSASLVNFGGSTPSAVIGAHAFYVHAGHRTGTATQVASVRSQGPVRSRASDIFVGENRMGEFIAAHVSVADGGAARPHRDSSGGIFVAEN